MKIRICILLARTLVAGCWPADNLSVPQLIELTHTKRSREITAAMKAALGEEKIAKGTAFLGEGAEFIFAVEADSLPALFIDDHVVGPMERNGETRLYFYIAHLKTGTAHSYFYTVNGQRFGGSYDVPAYGPDSYPKPGVPEGKLSEKTVHNSKIYEGMQSNYWIYVPAAYDPATPAALMVWQDGQNL